MKRLTLALAAVLAVMLTAGLWTRPASVRADSQEGKCRERQLFNDGWLFQADDQASAQAGQKAEQASFDDSHWQNLTLPHDWAARGDFDAALDAGMGRLKSWGPVWYRKHFSLSKDDAGKKIHLEVDGAMSHSTVWLNGQQVGGWPYGYTSFDIDLTGAAKLDGENVLAIKLENPPDSSRWYPGAGIYRNLWLTKYNPVHVARFGTFITTPEVSDKKATINIAINLQNESNSNALCTVRTDIFSYTHPMLQNVGQKIASVSTGGVKIGAAEDQSLTQQISIDNPNLWSVDSPKLYVAITKIEQDGHVLDSYESTFGIRTIKFDSQKGFLLNGKHVKLNGVCNHHDLGPLGAALEPLALDRQLSILKEMGCNAIRTSHNPPAPELLTLCDERGFLVMDESFDCWVKAKRQGDYHNLFEKWHDRDLRSQIHRDRNHPCVILWSIGNEIAEQSDPKDHHIASMLAKIVHEEDKTRGVTAACHDTAAGYNGFQKIVDVFGYNYKPFEYAKFHATHPDIPLFGSETASTVSSRGEYFFPVTDKMADAECDFQVSSYDLVYPSWATSPDAEFKGQDETPSVAGEFVWTGFDYIGEPTPFDNEFKTMPKFSDQKDRERHEKEFKESGRVMPPSRSSYFGIVDLAGFKKDRFYLYQSRWRPDYPMVHILPHWTWPERVGQITPVHVYTSGDQAELFLNGRSLGRKKKGQYEYRLRWDDVVYEPGTLKVVAYKNGKEWANEEVKTRGQAHAIRLLKDASAYERFTTAARKNDLVFATAVICDKDMEMAPRAKNEIEFAVEGPGKIIAIESGDAADLTPFSATTRKAFNGKCLVIVRATGDGKITLHARSPGLKEDSLDLHRLRF